MDSQSSLSWVGMMAARDSNVESLRSRIYYAARDGMAITLFALLGNTPKCTWKMYLEYPVEDEGQKCTPLIIAALNGNINVVKMLVNHFSPNIEQEGIVLVDGYVIEGATALWCAAGAGHYAIVKFLVAHGADVNHLTKSNSTPLRAACFDGWMEVIEFLVNSGADIHKSNKFSNTCLMLAAYRSHAHVVSYLMDMGSDPNAKAQCGATALHFASEHGHLDVVKVLLQKGAIISKNVNGMTPLLCAAERTKSELVEYFIGNSWCSKEESVEALELLGASYANDKDAYDLEKCYFYLNRAMTEREKHSELFPPKRLLSPIKAYDNHIECRTLGELEAIRNNVNALHMESLVIRERILGSTNPEVPHPVIYRGALFADSGQFHQCVELWLHALNLRHQSHLTVRKDLLRFAQVFAQMMHIGVEVTYEQIRQVLHLMLEELKRNRAIIDHSLEDPSENELSENIYTTLYLLVIITKLLKKLSPEEEQYVYEFVYKVNKLNLTTSNGSSLLHLAVNADTHVDEFHTKLVCKFPCASTSRLLIQCGADVNLVDHDGNTPLHIIVAYQKPITDFMTLHSIIIRLIEAGSHIDRVNNAGESPFDAVLTGVADIILKTRFQLSLKCLSAKAVKKYNIPYKGIIPETLVSFTDMHGATVRKKKK